MTDTKSHILVVDDELSMRELFEIMLEKEGYRVSCVENGTKAVAFLKQEKVDLLLCDIRLGDIDGIQVLKTAKEQNPHAVVIMISAFSSAENAVEAMNAGAYDYVPKPFDNVEMIQTIQNALDFKTSQQEKRSQDGEVSPNTRHFGKIVGNSPRMMYIYDMIRQVAKTRTNVLITGESGTGKELIARAIHAQSDRRDKPFMTINCGGIPETLMESEFFGHRKGSFTGANQDKKGLFETAHQGTVFLDEIGEISQQMQVKLLRAVQEKAFKSVGGTRDISVDIRIITATNRNLTQEVIEGRFREDLFYRLNVIEIKVPPLRERKQDIKLLAQHFLDKYSEEMGKQVTKISSYAVELLKKYDFPGNIRELENLLERSVALTNTNILLPDSLALSVNKRRWIEGVKGKRFDLDEVAHGVALDSILAEIERAYLEKALELTNGNKNKAADLLGITFRSLRYRLDKLTMTE
ncbi:MAG: sigma-54 dependent transcriptional regulator [Deltaproteobacteria bacterium]|nr:sigma-54 dependent transcriptional regulator [Deltaproteobacteria bacterium]